MNILWVIVLYSIAASFFSMLIYRLNNNISLIKPKFSFCPHCQQRLGFFDLIPVLGYLKNRGKCSNCHKKIDPNYFLIELIFIGVGLLGYLMSLPLVAVFLYLSLIVIFFSDIKYQEIPYTFMFLTLLLVIIDGYQGFYQNVTNIFYVAVFYVMIVLVEKIYYRKQVFGRADIILFAIFAFYLPRPLFILFVYLSFFLGAIIALILIAFKLIRRDAYIPFAPFIIISFFITRFFGNWLLNSYLQIF